MSAKDAALESTQVKKKDTEFIYFCLFIINCLSEEMIKSSHTNFIHRIGHWVFLNLFFLC